MSAPPRGRRAVTQARQLLCERPSGSHRLPHFRFQGVSLARFRQEKGQSLRKSAREIVTIVISNEGAAARGYYRPSMTFPGPRAFQRNLLKALDFET